MTRTDDRRSTTCSPASVPPALTPSARPTRRRGRSSRRGSGARPGRREPGRRSDLWRGRPDQVAADEARARGALDHDTALVRARDAAIAPLQATLARQLKRALADEQNEVFDRLRRRRPGGPAPRTCSATSATTPSATGPPARTPVWGGGAAPVRARPRLTASHRRRPRGCARTPPGARRGARRGHPARWPCPLREQPRSGARRCAGGDPEEATACSATPTGSGRPSGSTSWPASWCTAPTAGGAFAAAPAGTLGRAGSSTRPRPAAADGGGERRGRAATLRRGVPDRASASAGARRLPMPARSTPTVSLPPRAHPVGPATTASPPRRQAPAISHRGPHHPHRRRRGAAASSCSCRRGGSPASTPTTSGSTRSGLGDVFSGVLLRRGRPRRHLHAVLRALLCVNLLVADRLAPRFRQPGPEEQFLERYHADRCGGRRAWFARIGVSLLFGLIAGIPASPASGTTGSCSPTASSFGIKDPLFDTDIGFYVFRLPFLTFVVRLAVRLARHHPDRHGRGPLPERRHPPAGPGPAGDAAGEGPPLGAARPCSRSCKAAGYWLQRYELMTSTRGFVDGATYTDVNAAAPGHQPADPHLARWPPCCSSSTSGSGAGALPVIAVGLWGWWSPSWPARSTRRSCSASRCSRPSRAEERRTSTATSRRPAAGHGPRQGGATSRTRSTRSTTADDVDRATPTTCENVRLLDPAVVAEDVQAAPGLRGYYQFNDLDVDRYDVDGDDQQVVLAARELNTDRPPGRHVGGPPPRLHPRLRRGHGARPAKIQADGEPGLPRRSRSTAAGRDLARPEIYFGEELARLRRRRHQAATRSPDDPARQRGRRRRYRAAAA